MDDSANSVAAASCIHCRPCAPYFLWGLLRVPCRRADSDDSAIHVEAPPGLFFDSRCVNLADSADSAGNSLQMWTLALFLYQCIMRRRSPTDSSDQLCRPPQRNRLHHAVQKPVCASDTWPSLQSLLRLRNVDDSLLPFINTVFIVCISFSCCDIPCVGHHESQARGPILSSWGLW